MYSKITTGVGIHLFQIQSLHSVVPSEKSMQKMDEYHRQCNLICLFVVTKILEPHSLEKCHRDFLYQTTLISENVAVWRIQTKCSRSQIGENRVHSRWVLAYAVFSFESQKASSAFILSQPTATLQGKIFQESFSFFSTQSIHCIFLSLSDFQFNSFISWCGSFSMMFHVWEILEIYWEIFCNPDCKLSDHWGNQWNYWRIRSWLYLVWRILDVSKSNHGVHHFLQEAPQTEVKIFILPLWRLKMCKACQLSAILQLYSFNHCLSSFT